MVQEITKILEQVETVERWSINLVKINVSKKEGIKYITEELSDFDSDGIVRLVKEISNIYTVGDKSDKYRSIEMYDSVLVSDVIYEMDVTNELIRDAYSIFINALSDPDKESNPTKNKYDCYVLKSCIKVNGEDTSIKLIFMNNPIKTLKNKFIKIKEKYTEITDKVISLSLSVDMIIWKNKIFFFNNTGEKLFNMERTYKTICQEKIKVIKDNEIISDIDSFIDVANSGYNPRRFISFNKGNLEMLKNNAVKSEISSKFKIPLIDGKFDTSKPETSEKLIKLLCGKGKLDPFNNEPVEVAGAKEWR